MSFNLYLKFAVILSINLQIAVCSKCAFTFGSGTAICDNISSMQEVVREIRNTWLHLHVNNRRGGTFVISGKIESFFIKQKIAEVKVFFLLLYRKRR